MKHWTFFFAFSASAMLGGCKKNTAAAPEAYVSREQLVTAIDHLKSLDYLPWGYKFDGCFARSLYMSMELATKQIPTSAYFVFEKSKTEPLIIPGRIGTWWYHVAPLVYEKETRRELVLDPSLRVGPVKKEEWEEMMGANKPSFILLPGSVYVSAAFRHNYNHRRMIETFSALPPFQLEDIQSACGVMFEFLGNAGAKDKREKLLTRTQELVKQLNKLGKVSNSTIEMCGNINIETAKGILHLYEVDQGSIAPQVMQTFEKNICREFQGNNLAAFAQEGLFVDRPSHSKELVKECISLHDRPQ